MREEEECVCGEGRGGSSVRSKLKVDTTRDEEFQLERRIAA